MTVPAPSGSPEPAKKPSTTVKIIAAVIFGLVALICLIGIAANMGDDEPGGETTMAEIMCEGFIEDHLKSPASAEYSHTTAFTDPTYTVVGTVDSENSFGAMLRSEYTCVVELVGEDEWRLESLDIE